MIALKNSLRIRAMKEGKEILEKDPILWRIVEIIVKEIDPDKIILFGSRARGDYKEDSDYDILVLKKGIRPENRRKLEGKIYLSLKAIGIPVEVFVQDSDRYEELKDKWFLFYYDVEREGKVIYDRRKGMVGIR